MIWLIHQLVRGLKVSIRGIFIGPPSFQPRRKRQVETPLAIPHGNRPPFQQFAYGPMLVRVWQNWSKRGELYFNLDIVREVGKGRIAKSFRPEDLDDVERCLYKVRAEAFGAKPTTGV